MRHNSVEDLLCDESYSHGSLGHLYNTSQQQPRTSNRSLNITQTQQTQHNQCNQRVLQDSSGRTWTLKQGQPMNSTTMPGFKVDWTSAARHAQHNANDSLAFNTRLLTQLDNPLPQTKKDAGIRKVYSGDNDEYYNFTSMPSDDYNNDNDYIIEQKKKKQTQQQTEQPLIQLREITDDEPPLFTRSTNRQESQITLSKPKNKITMDFDDDLDEETETAIKQSLADLDTTQLDLQVYNLLKTKYPTLQLAYIEIDKLTNNNIFLKNELDTKTNDNLKQETKIRKYEDLLNKQTDVINKLQTNRNNGNPQNNTYMDGLIKKNGDLTNENRKLTSDRDVLINGAKELKSIIKGLECEKDFFIKKVAGLENEITEINKRTEAWKISKMNEINILKDAAKMMQQNDDAFSPKYMQLNDRFKILDKRYTNLNKEFDDVSSKYHDLQLTNLDLEVDVDLLLTEILINRGVVPDNRAQETRDSVEKLITDYQTKTQQKAESPKPKQRRRRGRHPEPTQQVVNTDNAASDSISSSNSIAHALDMIMKDVSEKGKDTIKDDDDSDTEEKGKEKVREVTTSDDNDNKIFIPPQKKDNSNEQVIQLSNPSDISNSPPSYDSIQQGSLLSNDDTSKALGSFKPKETVVIKKIISNSKVYNVDIGYNDVDTKPRSDEEEFSWADNVEEADRNDTVYVNAKPYGNLPVGDAKVGNIMVYHGVNASRWNMKRMMFYSQRPFSPFPIGEETEKFYVSSLTIIPAIDDEHTMGYFGSIEKYKVKHIDSLPLKSCVTRRIKTNNGAISFNIPSCLNTTPDNEIIASFNKGVEVFSTFQKNARVNLGLSITLFNNMLRRSGQFFMPPANLIEQYEQGKPVFGKILQSIGDGNLILDGKWIESAPVGGYQINASRTHYGPFKANNPWHKQKIIWDTTGMEVTIENVEKSYKELESYYSQTRQLVCYHLYMSRQTIHFHVFDTVEDIKYSMMCDLITDYPKTLLNKGAPLDILYPIHPGAEDVTMLAIAFYCSAIRMAPSLYNAALEGNLNLENLMLLFKATPCYKDIADDWWNHRVVTCETASKTFGKYFVKPTDMHIKYVEKMREVSGTIIEHGYVHPNHWENYVVDIEAIIHPSPSALQYEPQISPTSTWKTHETFFANGRSNCEVPRNYNIPNVVCGKTCYNRGKAKMVDMLGINFVRKVLVDANSILILGEKRGGFAHALCENGIFKKKLYLLDLQFEPGVIAEFGDRCLQRDIASLTIEDINKFDVVISDVCDSKGVLNSRFMQIYDNWVRNAKSNITFLLKLKGIMSEGVKTKYGTWVDTLANTYSRTYLIKPYSSRCRNSEVYFYLDKQFLHNSSGSLCYYYAEELEKRIRDNEQFLVHSTVYSMMTVMTPLQPMDVREFIKYIPNKGSAEFILEKRETFELIAGCFAKTRMFRVGDKYYFQGEDFKIATKFNVYRRKHVRVGTGLWESVSCIPPIRVVQRTINPKPSIIANCIKDTIIDKFYNEDVVDFGCGESGQMYHNNEHVTYASAFKSYEGIDPKMNIKFEDYHTESRGKIALFIQSAHNIGLTMEAIIRKCFTLGFKMVIYNTQKSSRIRIKHSGKGSMGDWYSNDEGKVTWCGETNRLLPSYGQVFGISFDYFRTYNRTFNNTWRTVASDQAICVVTPTNFKKVVLYGATFTGITSTSQMFSPKAREELSVKKEGEENFVSKKTTDLFKNDN